MGWSIWDLWEYKGRKRKYTDDIVVTGEGTYEHKLDFIPDDVHAHFVEEEEYDDDDQQPSCVPIGPDQLEIKNYFSLVVIKWKINDGCPRIIKWSAKT